MGERSVLQSLNRVGSTRSAPSASSPAAQAAYAAGSPSVGRPRRSDPGGPRKSAAFTGRKSWARWPFTWGRRRSSISKFFEKCRKSARKGAFFLFICGKRSAAGGKSFRARRGDERFRPPGGRTVGPTISFLQKETVPPGGTREKSSGVTMPSAPPEAKKHPRHPHRACGKRFHPADCGAQGPFRASCRTLSFYAPGAFLLDRQAARSLFARKENGGLGSTPLGGG